MNVNLWPFHDACGNGTGRIVAQVSGGMAPYQFVWTPGTPVGQGTSVISDLFVGTYTLTLTDALG
ncbi:MAG: hypothetical protein M3R08_03530, partial [Bacteroidota bacterium]|nr:hypothetical protein [Bacteroidota bacterium]